ncbi:MAG: hypothetical protein R2697_08320 [Ilumatobacteraceae bacterium]
MPFEVATLCGSTPVRPEPGHFGADVEWTNDGLVLFVAPLVGGHQPHHLELDAVGVRA